MKILIIDTYYEFFLQQFYKKHPEFEPLGYEEHRKHLMLSRFSASDAYSHFFKKAGHEAEEIVFNDNKLQLKWARENGIKVLPLPGLISKGLNAAVGWDWRFEVLRAQVKKYKPDVIYIKEQSLLTDAMVNELKVHSRLIAMQVGSRLLKRRTFKGVDIAFTSFPHFVSLFENMGLRAHYLKICFDPRILNEIEKRPPIHPLSFVGGISLGQHRARNEILETAAEEFPLKWFGYSTSVWNQNRRLRKVWAGPVWGLEMYQALSDSQVTLNVHGEIAKSYANNVRLYEATGVGACLLTDWKENLSEIFEPEKEIVTYRSIEELREKIKYLLRHPDVCAEIGQAGKQRTLRDHTYEKRVEELIAVFRKYLDKERIHVESR